MRLVSFADLNGVAADVCIVGAGPVGLAIAHRLSKRGLKVLVLEAGDARGVRSLAAPNDHIVGSHHAPLSIATASGLGGTSRFWGGRCLPLDPIDLEARWAGQEAWPIGYHEVAAHFDSAAAFLGCGPAHFSDPETASLGANAEGLRADSLERWCDEPQIAARLRRIALSDRVLVSPASTVTAANLDIAGGRVTSLDVSCGGAPIRLSAPVFIVAAGGVETARLLLATQARHQMLFGGVAGPLGRYYMGHLSGSIADIVFASPSASKLFRYRQAPRSMVRRRLTFDPSVLREELLPNVGFYPDNPRLADASHGQGVLSALYLLLSAPGIGPRLLPEAIRGMQVREPSSLGAHLRNVAWDAPHAAAVMAQLLWQRVVRGRRKPSLFLTSSKGRHPLHFHAEQRPSADSRISLVDAQRPGQLSRLRIDLRFEETDVAAVERAHEALDRRLQRAGLGKLVFRHSDLERRHAILAGAQDGYHQIGVTRMGADPTDSVVDRDCRAHGLDNLYVAGSAVFRTGGQANPTFFATALGFRLADHIAARRTAA